MREMITDGCYAQPLTRCFRAIRILSMLARINASRIQLSNYKRVAKKQQFYVLFFSSLLCLNRKVLLFFLVKSPRARNISQNVYAVYWKWKFTHQEKEEAFYGQSREASGFDRRVSSGSFYWMFPHSGFWCLLVDYRRQKQKPQPDDALTLDHHEKLELANSW